MNPFPFSEIEWEQVRQASHSVLNATLADDVVLRASKLIDLQDVLDHLRARYGEHPILDETEADFLDDPSMQLDKYRSAIRLANENSLPTLSIGLSLARMLVEEFADLAQAEKELTECQPELDGNVDQSQNDEWTNLMKTCVAHRVQDSE